MTRFDPPLISLVSLRGRPAFQRVDSSFELHRPRRLHEHDVAVANRLAQNFGRLLDRRTMQDSFAVHPGLSSGLHCNSAERANRDAAADRGPASNLLAQLPMQF